PTVTIRVAGLNDAPMAVANEYETAEDAVLTGDWIVDDTGAGADSDPDTGDVLTVSGYTIGTDPTVQPIGATITLSSGATLRVTSNGSFEYDPTGSAMLNALSVGQTFLEDPIKYMISDGQPMIDAEADKYMAPITIRVRGVNDNPVATDNNYAANQGDTITGNLITDDTGAGMDEDVDFDGTPPDDMIMVTQ
ncbi:MAG: hypothetical protein KDA42_20155, partial [Planctomycetales bacterium]|nr:hypothetical protein [Planctomycetales bacterium]